jgi:ribose 5-phosphate isomerase B
MRGDGVRKIALGADASTAGQRAVIARWLESQGYAVVEEGAALPGGQESVDAIEAALAVCRRVSSGDCERGIVLDVSGIGPCMAANKILGIRAAACWDLRTAIDSRERDKANVLALGAPMHGIDELCAMIRAWLAARFDAPRHAARVNRISSIERGGF